MGQQSRPSHSTDRRRGYDRVSKDATSPAVKRTVTASHHAPTPPSRQGGSKTDMSFIMLTESQVVPPESPTTKGQGKRQKPTGSVVEDEERFSIQMETATRLYEILSARSDIDQPICTECTERLVEQLQKRMGTATRERDAYVEFLRQANGDIPTDEEYVFNKLKKAECRS